MQGRRAVNLKRNAGEEYPERGDRKKATVENLKHDEIKKQSNCSIIYRSLEKPMTSTQANYI